MNIHGKTTVCAVIGDPVGHSLSPCMHNAAYRAKELDFVYVAFHVKDVEKAISGMTGFGIRGLSVTIPHKLAVMPYLDEISPLSQKIGAVNTITNENGRLLGTNTDGYGALKAIESQERVDDKNVVVLGVGGSSRAAAFALSCERKPSRMTLVGRDSQKARSLATEISQHSDTPIAWATFDENELYELFQEADIIVNTTPIGMHPNVAECLIPENLFSERHFVYDMIYNPAETLLLKRAKSNRARTLNGVPMFVHQGAEQFRLWTGEQAPIEIMQDTVERALGHR